MGDLESLIVPVEVVLATGGHSSRARRSKIRERAPRGFRFLVREASGEPPRHAGTIECERIPRWEQPVNASIEGSVRNLPRFIARTRIASLPPPVGRRACGDSLAAHLIRELDRPRRGSVRRGWVL